MSKYKKLGIEIELRMRNSDCESFPNVVSLPTDEYCCRNPSCVQDKNLKVNHSSHVDVYFTGVIGLVFPSFSFYGNK